MRCARCAREIGDDSAYCAHCGATKRAPGAGRTRTRLEQSATDRQIAGICDGLGLDLGLDPAPSSSGWSRAWRFG